MKIPVWATFFVLASIVLFLFLGFWQLHRLSWKERLIAQIQEQHALDAKKINLSQIAFNSFDNKNQIYLRGYVKGRYLNEKQIFIGPRTYEGRPGYDVVTPLMVDGSGAILFVNRGWIAHDLLLQARQGDIWLNGAVTITGLLRNPPDAPWFIQDNVPSKGLWTHYNLIQFAREFSFLRFSQLLFFAESETGDIHEDFFHPVYEQKPAVMNNNHLGYAVFWFSMIPVLVCIYVIRFLFSSKNLDITVR